MARSAEKYIESLYAKDRDLQRVLDGIEASGMPQVSVAPVYGKLLTLLVRISGASSVLEIGSLGGYSGICLARGLSGEGRLISLELNPEFAEMSRRHLEMSGLADRVEYRVGEALQSLRELEREAAAFDFFFIDADKGNYPDYLEWAIHLSRPGALIVADNLWLHGKTFDPEKETSSVQTIRLFNRRIATDSRLESVMLPAYDGLAIARVRPAPDR